MATLRYDTAGESHGPALTCVVSGMPTGLALSRDAIDAMMERRQGGHGRSARQRIERDVIEVTSGIRHGRTLGSPIGISLENKDHGQWLSAMSPWEASGDDGWRSRSVTTPRPGHADLAGVVRSGSDDIRTVLERASARETAMQVAAGAIAAQLLQQLGISVRSHVVNIGGVSSPITTPAHDEWNELDASPVYCLDADASRRMVDEIDAAAAAKDSLGGVIETVVYGLPPGIGGYATRTERLDGRLAGVAMAVHAIKSVEFGDGLSVAQTRGSAAQDEMSPDHGGWTAGRTTNHAGGVEGGMSNGMPVVMRCSMKPLSTLMQPLGSLDISTGEPADAHVERSDVCAVPAASVVLEAVVAFELAAVIREQFGMQAMHDLSAAWNHYIDRSSSLIPSPTGPVG